MGPGGEGGGDGAGGAADAGAVEEEDGARGGEGVDEGGVPVVHGAAVVHVEEEGDAGGAAEAAVGELGVVDGDVVSFGGFVEGHWGEHGGGRWLGGLFTRRGFGISG